MPQFQNGGVIVQQKEIFDPVTGKVVSKDTKIAGGSKDQLVGAFQEGISVKEHARVEAELIRAVQIAQEAQDKAAALEAENLRLRALAANGGVYHTDYDNVRNENVELKQTNQVLSAQASHCHEEMLKSQAKLGEAEGMVQLLTGQRDMYLRQVTTLQQYPAVQQIIAEITARENAAAAAAAAAASGAFAPQQQQQVVAPQQQQVVASSVGNKPASYAGTRPKLAGPTTPASTTALETVMFVPWRASAMMIWTVRLISRAQTTPTLREPVSSSRGRMLVPKLHFFGHSVANRLTRPWARTLRHGVRR